MSAQMPLPVPMPPTIPDRERPAAGSHPVRARNEGSEHPVALNVPAADQTASAYGTLSQEAPRHFFDCPGFAFSEAPAPGQLPAIPPLCVPSPVPAEQPAETPAEQPTADTAPDAAPEIKPYGVADFDYARARASADSECSDIGAISALLASRRADVPGCILCAGLTRYATYADLDWTDDQCQLAAETAVAAAKLAAKKAQKEAERDEAGQGRPKAHYMDLACEVIRLDSEDGCRLLLLEGQWYRYRRGYSADARPSAVGYSKLSDADVIDIVHMRLAQAGEASNINMARNVVAQLRTKCKAAYEDDEARTVSPTFRVVPASEAAKDGNAFKLVPAPDMTLYANGAVNAMAVFKEIALAAREGRDPHHPADMSHTLDDTWFSEITRPMAFDPYVTGCPTVDSVIDTVVDAEDDKAMLWRLLGILVANIRTDSFWALVGKPSGGKSTFLSIMEKLIGARHTSHVEVNALGEKFDNHSISGKLLNIAAETSNNNGSMVMPLAAEKQLRSIASMENITLQEKNVPAYETKSRCLMVFASNTDPKFHDKTGALKRRFRGVYFPKVFIPAPPVAGVQTIEDGIRSMSDAELVAAHNKAMLLYADFLLDNSPMLRVLSASGSALAERCFLAHDSVSLFWDDGDGGAFRVDDQGAVVATCELYAAYKIWCRDGGYEPTKRHLFVEGTEHAIGSVCGQYTRADGKRLRGFRGVALVVGDAMAQA